MFTMNCTARAKSQPERETLRDYLRVHSAGGYNVNLGAGMYCPDMVDTADARRRVHLEQAAEIHDELFPHLKRGAASIA